MPIAPSFGINVYLETFLAKHGGLKLVGRNETLPAEVFSRLALTAYSMNYSCRNYRCRYRSRREQTLQSPRCSRVLPLYRDRSSEMFSKRLRFGARCSVAAAPWPDAHCCRAGNA